MKYEFSVFWIDQGPKTFVKEAISKDQAWVEACKEIVRLSDNSWAGSRTVESIICIELRDGWPGITDEHLVGDLKRGELPE